MFLEGILFLALYFHNYYSEFFQIKNSLSNFGFRFFLYGFRELTKRINRSYINSFEEIKLLEQIRAVYLGQAITVVLDNAKYQRCNAVIEKAKALHIELLFLPSYSPNLNLIERLWRFVKKECLYSKYYKSADEFETAIVKCLGEINTAKKHKMETLMTLKFQLFPDSPTSQGNSLGVAA